MFSTGPVLRPLKFVLKSSCTSLLRAGLEGGARRLVEILTFIASLFTLTVRVLPPSRHHPWQSLVFPCVWSKNLTTDRFHIGSKVTISRVGRWG